MANTRRWMGVRGGLLLAGVLAAWSLPGHSQVVNLSAPQAGASAPTQAAAAQQPPVAKGAAAPGELLALQRSGAAASTTQYIVPAAVASKVYGRYVDSFDRAIPEWHHPNVGHNRAGSGGGR